MAKKMCVCLAAMMLIHLGFEGCDVAADEGALERSQEPLAAEEWVFEAETLAHKIGRADGVGWSASVEQDNPGYLVHGPQETPLPGGKKTAQFSMMIDDNLVDDAHVATIDVKDATSGDILASAFITRKKFNAAMRWQTFELCFASTALHKLEYRVYWPDKAYVSVDKITVARQASWVYEAEALSHGTGLADGIGWSARPGQDAPMHMVYGPYDATLPGGAKIAKYRLLVDDNTADDAAVATIDVNDATTGAVLASRTVTRKQFSKPMEWQTFELNFSNKAKHSLEFRVYWPGAAYVAVDKITILEPLHWMFEAEYALGHGVGRLDNNAWSASVGQDPEGFLVRGPRVTTIPSGHKTALFKLLIDNNTADDWAVATVDVRDATSNTILYSKVITRKRFSQAWTWQTFALDFNNSADAALEFRVKWHALAYIAADNVAIREVAAPPPPSPLAVFDSRNYPIADIDDHLAINPTAFDSFDKLYLVARNQGSLSSWPQATWDMGSLTGFFPPRWNTFPNSVQRSVTNSRPSCGFQANGKVIGWTTNTAQNIPAPGNAGGPFSGITYRYTPAQRPSPWASENGKLRLTTRLKIPVTNLTNDLDLTSKFEIYIFDRGTGTGIFWQNKFFHEGPTLPLDHKAMVDKATQSYMAMAKHADASSFHTRTAGFYKTDSFGEMTTFQVTIDRSELGNAIDAVNTLAGSQVLTKNWSDYMITNCSVNTEMPTVRSGSGHYGVSLEFLRCETL